LIVESGDGEELESPTFPSVPGDEEEGADGSPLAPASSDEEEEAF